MINFSGYTAKAIEQAMLNQVPAEIDTREGSIVQTAIGPTAWYLEGIYLLLAQMQDNASADKAVGESLDRKVQERGLSRKPAIAAVRKGIFNVPVIAGSQFKTMNGANSVAFFSGDLISQDEEGCVYAMTCSTPGILGNSYQGNLLPVTAVSGLTSAVLGEVILAGVEEESDEALRARYFETFHTLAFGGNIPSYRKTILEISGVGAVQVYPVWKGGGSVLCSILDYSFQPASPALVEYVQEIICPSEDGESDPSVNGYGMAPIGAAVTITTAEALPVHITCHIEFSAGVQNGADTCQEEIERKIREYLLMVSKSWGNPLKGHTINYGITVYISRIIFAILSVEQVANVTDVMVNGSGEDLHLTETAELQQIPVLGTVVLYDE